MFRHRRLLPILALTTLLLVAAPVAPVSAVAAAAPLCMSWAVRGGGGDAVGCYLPDTLLVGEKWRTSQLLFDAYPQLPEETATVAAESLVTALTQLEQASTSQSPKPWQEKAFASFTTAALALGGSIPDFVGATSESPTPEPALTLLSIAGDSMGHGLALLGDLPADPEEAEQVRAQARQEMLAAWDHIQAAIAA